MVLGHCMYVCIRRAFADVQTVLLQLTLNFLFITSCLKKLLWLSYFLKMRKTVLEVEYPLIEGQLALIDRQLERAEKLLNWQSEGK